MIGKRISQTRARRRGFTLVETTVVVTVAGILASLAMPSMMDVARIYRAEEGARHVVSAFSQARGLSQRNNAPVAVRIFDDRVDLLVGAYGPPPFGFLMTAQAWTIDRTIVLPSDVRILATGSLAPGDVIAFCASGEYRFIDGTGTVSTDGVGTPVCGFGDLASRSGTIEFFSSLKPFTIEIRAPLAHLRIVTGSAP